MIKIMDIPFHQRKRQINKKNNRESIITSSRKILTEKSIDNASVREIVSIAKLGSGTFYNYFDDKNAVFLTQTQQNGIYENSLSLSGSGDDLGVSLCQLTNGSIILVGTTESNDGDFEGLRSKGTDIFIAILNE